MSHALSDGTVYLVKTPPNYPTIIPYHPSIAYPEYPFSAPISNHPNLAYQAVRELFRLIGLWLTGPAFLS